MGSVISRRRRCRLHFRSVSGGQVILIATQERAIAFQGPRCRLFGVVICLLAAVLYWSGSLLMRQRH